MRGGGKKKKTLDKFQRMTTNIYMRKQGEGRMETTRENFSARIDADLVEALRARARDEERSIGTVLSRILRAALKGESQGPRRAAKGR